MASKRSLSYSTIFYNHLLSHLYRLGKRGEALMAQERKTIQQAEL